MAQKWCFIVFPKQNQYNHQFDKSPSQSQITKCMIHITQNQSLVHLYFHIYDSKLWQNLRKLHFQQRHLEELKLYHIRSVVRSYIHMLAIRHCRNDKIQGRMSSALIQLLLVLRNFLRQTSPIPRPSLALLGWLVRPGLIFVFVSCVS